MDTKRLISIVVPAYNEEEALPLFYEQLRAVLDELSDPYEIIFYFIVIICINSLSH